MSLRPRSELTEAIAPTPSEVGPSASRAPLDRSNEESGSSLGDAQSELKHEANPDSLGGVGRKGSYATPTAGNLPRPSEPMHTCSWQDEDENGFPAGEPCGKPATHFSCTNMSRSHAWNACEEHKCRCARPIERPRPNEALKCLGCARPANNPALYCSYECFVAHSTGKPNSLEEASRSGWNAAIDRALEIIEWEHYPRAMHTQIKALRLDGARTDNALQEAATLTIQSMQARINELEAAIGVMVPTIIRAFIELRPPDATVDHEVATKVLARVEAAMKSARTETPEVK